MVQQSANRLLTITSNPLDITQIEAGRIELEVRPTDLRHLVRTAVAELEFELQEAVPGP